MLEQILREIEQHGWSKVSHFLSADELRAISLFFEEHKSEFKPAKVGTAENRVRKEEVRGDYTFWLDPLNPPEVFKPLIKFLNNLRDALNKRFFLGLQEFECHLAFYPSGTFYRKHLDRFEKNSSRSLSFVFYLNEKWNDEDGGELVLYHQDGKTLESVSPGPGTFICFLSEDFPHEVKSATTERRSLTGWMHTKIIY